MRNLVDDAEDTLTSDGVSATAHAAGGDVASGDIFKDLQYVIALGAPSCTGGPPCASRRRARVCRLPKGKIP
jgi:hypothetical protein